MSIYFRTLASTRLTLVGMALLGLGAALSYDNPVDTPVWVLVVPMLVLATNLSAAIITNPRINRQGGLLVFHLGLLAIVVLAAIGRLTHMEAHIEMLDGTGFESEQLIDIKAGVFHNGNLDEVAFIQGPYTVDYSAGLIRGLTNSHVSVPDGKGGWQRRVVGDDRPLVLEGYRFYTTFNKGFAPVLTWVPDQGESVTGTVNMPSYPLYIHRQANQWTPPGGQEIKFWLQLETGLDENAEWVLAPSQSNGVLVVNSNDQRIELTLGQSTRLQGGLLRYEELRSWMGYKLYYDPTIQWLFVTSMMAVFGLSIHFWRKFGTHPIPDIATVPSRKAELKEIPGSKVV